MVVFAGSGGMKAAKRSRATAALARPAPETPSETGGRADLSASPAGLDSHCADPYRLYFQSAPDAMLLLDARTQAVLDANQAALALYGYERDELLGKTGRELSGGPEAAAPEPGVVSAPISPRLHRRKDGEVFPVEVGFASLAAAGRDIALATVRDVSGRMEADQALRESEQRYRIVADYNYDLEMWHAPDGALLYISPSCERITGHPAAAFYGRPDFLEEITVPGYKAVWDELREALARDERQFAADFQILHADGLDRWISLHCQKVYGLGGADLGLRSSSRDITERKHLEMEFQHLAFHDPLTGLPNRKLCLDRIAQALERSKRRENYHYAVIFLDLDRFKVVNDSLGHYVGDQLLVSVSRKIKAQVRTLDTVARYGGDEFVVLLEEIASAADAIDIARRIKNEIKEPLSLCGYNIHISASLGIVLSPAIYDRPEDLLRNANIAMHRAKDQGRDKLKVFNTGLLEEAINIMRVETDLRRALERDEFVIHFQPIIALGDKRLTGFEALLRWRHPQLGMVQPDDFIHVAEETGLIIPIGLWVIEQSCRIMADWQARHADAAGLTVNVNLSAKQLSQTDLVERVDAILRAEGLAPEALKLEITESVMMDNPELAVNRLKRLKALGVKLSMDDFGTGYSSLGYLQKFPVDTLKVDRSFIMRLDVESESSQIIKAVIALAHSMGMDVVAEGIEEPHQDNLLVELKCECGQGFLYSRPVEAATIEAILDGRLVLDAQPNETH
ncbi:MAG: EAL domain-containing protein [Desulfovibrionaceae bacterium]|nr:EAL domain-containing protein [Desulfovibrionaceae bacterium]MBF0514380.1 EAL domain-containing protein [Desulfovibrionaceae bacterium]